MLPSRTAQTITKGGHNSPIISSNIRNYVNSTYLLSKLGLLLGPQPVQGAVSISLRYRHNPHRLSKPQSNTISAQIVHIYFYQNIPNSG